MGRTVVADCETDGLQPTRVWCLVAEDWDTNEVFKFIFPQDLDRFLEFAKTVTTWVGHNFLSFDAPVLNRLLGTSIPIDAICDTLIISRLVDASNIGNHSLEKIGLRLGHHKVPHEDWTRYSPEMLHRCSEDVKINKKYYGYLLESLKGYSKLSVRIEHLMQYILNEQKANGFLIDVEKAHKLFIECKELADQIEKDIHVYFPPRPKLVREVPLIRTMAGDIASRSIKPIGHLGPYVAGPYSLIEYEAFSLASPKQKVERLEPWWHPTVQTKGGATGENKTWKICEGNLETIRADAPEPIRKLVQWQMLNNRWKLVKEQWLDNLGPDDRVRGDVVSIGAITHRAAHQNPNTGNIPAIDKNKDDTPRMGVEGSFGYECRDCWIVPKGAHLVGVDAVGIQLRALAHYMNDPDYTKVVLSGDIHTHNMKALGEACKFRGDAKTFIYAWLLGAGVLKTSLILKCTMNEAKEAREKFLRDIPALRDLVNRSKKAAEKGYLVGLDGRRLPIKSAHYALSVYLQGFEAVIMKKAYIDWFFKLKKENLIRFKNLAWVHDEWQTEVWGNLSCAHAVGETQKRSIRDAGLFFKLNVPLEGDAKYGKSWAECH